VVSFSEDGDDLAQWRGYGRFGQGVAIGFQFTYDNWPVVDSNGIDVISILYKCLYTEKEQNRLFKAIVDALLSILAKQQVVASTAHGTTNESAMVVAEWAGWLLTAFTNTFPYMKSPAFETEQEVRLVLSPDKSHWSRKFRVSNGIVVPYFEVHEDGVRLPISRVVIGPSAKHEVIRDGVRRLLDAHEYDVPVESSEVPFRG
jgi:hypothetical protein